MDMRICSKGAAGFGCLLPTAHDGDCTHVPSVRVRDAWRTRRGEVPTAATSERALAQASLLLHQAKVAIDMKSLLASVRERRLATLEEQLLSRTHSLTAAAGVMTALSAEKAELEEEVEGLKAQLASAVAMLEDEMNKLGALKTAALAAAEAIERRDFGGTGGFKYALAIRAVLEEPE